MKDAWHLQRFDWLRELPDEEQKALAVASARRDYPAGQIIFAPTTTPHSVYLLERGIARIYRLSSYGAEATFGYVSAGEVFGELPALGDYRRESFAQAVRASTVWKIPRGVFRAMIAEHPELVIALVRQIGDRFKRIESRVENLVFRSVRARVALTLLELADDFGRDTEEGVLLDLVLSQAELATLVGTSRQSVNASLHELTEEGLIQLRRRRIILTQPERLARAAEEPNPT